MPSLKELLEAKKSTPATPAAKGIVLTSSGTPPAKAVEAGAAVGETAARALGSPKALDERSADVPFEFASEKPSEAARLWFQARQMPETSLCIVMDPVEDGMPPQHAWLALQTQADTCRPIFLHRLPLAAYQRPGNPF